MTNISVSNHLLLALLENSGEGIVACDDTGKIIYTNERARQMHAEGLLSDKVMGLLKRSLKDLGTHELDEGIADGDTVYMRLNSDVLKDPQGKVLGARVVITDITESKKTEERFRTIFSQSPLSTQIFAKDGTTKMVNRAWQDLWGVTTEFIETFILKEYNVLHDPLLNENGVLPLIHSAFNGEVVRVPKILYDPRKLGLGGTPRWVEAMMYPLKDINGNVNEVVVVHMDVTQEHRADEAQRFLSQVATRLISTLDYEHMIEELASSVTSSFTDGCIVDIFESNEIKRIVSRHKDPEIQKLMDELQRSYPPTLNTPQPSSRVINSKQPELLPEVDLAVIKSHCINEKHADLIQKIGMTSHIAVPLERGGQIIGALCVFMTGGRRLDELDIRTAQNLGRKASMALENARLYQNVKKALKHRDEFISIASHELKTPLTSLKLQMQVSGRMAGKPEGQKMDAHYVKNLTETANRQLDRLTRLVEDMLDISRIASGKLPIQRSKVDFSALTRDVLTRFEDELQDLEIQKTFNIQGDIQLKCDPFRMEQVITNLITNAIRYGNGRPIEVDLFRSGDKVVLKVKDHGRGIAKEDIGRIFNRFERAISASDVSGLGLGLSITKEIVLAHEGEIKVESELEKGTIFIVEIKDQ